MASVSEVPAVVPYAANLLSFPTTPRLINCLFSPPTYTTQIHITLFAQLTLGSLPNITVSDLAFYS